MRTSRWIAVGAGVTVVAMAAIIAGLTSSTAHQTDKATATHSSRLLRYPVVAHARLSDSPYYVMSTSAGVFVFEQHRILRLDPTTLRVTGNLGGSRPLGAFAYGDGSLWAVAGAPKKRVLRIDPTTFKVIQTIPVSGLPQSVAFGDGRVWVTVIQSSPNDLPNGTAPRMLERINPTTSKITAYKSLRLSSID